MHYKPLNVNWPGFCGGSKRQDFPFWPSQPNNKFIKDCLGLHNYSGLELEIHRLTENPVFISVFSGIYVSGEIEKEIQLSVTMPSSEELSELLFIFLLTSALSPESCTQAGERVQGQGYKNKPYKVHLKEWSTSDDPGSNGHYLQIIGARTSDRVSQSGHSWYLGPDCGGGCPCIVGGWQHPWPPRTRWQWLPR